MSGMENKAFSLTWPVFLQIIGTKESFYIKKKKISTPTKFACEAKMAAVSLF